MHIYTLHTKNKYFFARLITTRNPLQIDFVAKNNKVQKIDKTMPDHLELNPFLETSLEPDLHHYGLYSKKAFDLFCHLFNLEDAKITTVWYDKIPFYAIKPPLITSNSISEKSISVAEVMLKYYKKQPLDMFLCSNDGHPHVSENFKKTVESYQLTGFDFQLVWKDSAAV